MFVNVCQLVVCDIIEGDKNVLQSMQTIYLSFKTKELLYVIWNSVNYIDCFVYSCITVYLCEIIYNLLLDVLLFIPVLSVAFFGMIGDKPLKRRQHS